MAGSSSGYADEGDDAIISDINVTPLVDIVLVLLIVFMITMPTLVRMDTLKERELNIVLPQASEAMPLTVKPNNIVVNIDAEGHFIVRTKTLSSDELFKLLQQSQADNPGMATVKVAGDKRVPWQYVVNVINLCNKAKIRWQAETSK